MKPAPVAARLLAFPLLLLVATVWPAASRATNAPLDPLYPTDLCVAHKLEAAGRACRDVVLAQGLPAPALEKVKAASRERLAAAFTDAETEAAEAGVDCAQTTVTSAEMSTTIEDGAVGLVASVADDTRGGRPDLAKLAAAGQTCRSLVKAEARHLVLRGWDRDASWLERERDHALVFLRWSLAFVDFWKHLFFWKHARNGAADLEQRVVALAQDVIEGGIVSPNVPSTWTMVTPDASVTYRGKVLEPSCAEPTIDGQPNPWVYFVKRGTVNKLVMYYQGGGACWDVLTCGLARTFKRSTGPGDNPGNARSGFANLNDPRNPFKDWNAVFVPYCTGDVHWGDSTVVYDPGGFELEIHHKGFVNAQVAEKFAREHFVHPEQVFVTGSSAGAYGAIMNGVQLMERVYPSTLFATLGDAGNGVITQSFVQTGIVNWGIEANLPSWIPALDKPVPQLDASILWAAPAAFYPRNRFANYATAYDGGSGGQTGFFHVMSNPGNLSVWSRWWESSCAWDAGMRAQVAKAYAGAPANYRYYIGSGARHTMWGSDKVYADTTGGVPLLVDWVNAMLEGSAAWVNVETSDPGLLLAGDPRPPASPTPPIYPPPYTDDGRIVCPAAP